MFFLKSKYLLIIFFIGLGIFWADSSYAQTLLFNVDPLYDWKGRNQIRASERYEGANAYFYIEDEQWKSLRVSGRAKLLSDVEELSQEFDDVIYPRLRALFGSENNPGIDGDPKIYVVLSHLTDDTGGYFREQDGFSKDKVTDTNEHEMLFLNSIHAGNPRLPSFLAHEFQHLVTFNQKNLKHGVSEDVWLNELRSEITPTILGYDNVYFGSNLEARVKIFLEDPVDAILNWENEAKDYAAINPLGQYILDHYGRSVIAAMIENDKVGIESFNEALGVFGFQEDFSEIFTNWTIATLVNDCSLHTRELYCYKNPNLNYKNLHITFSAPDAVGNVIETMDVAQDWEASWFELARVLETQKPKDDVLRLDFSAPEGSNFRVPYVIYKEDNVGVKYIREISLTNGSGKFFVEDFGFKIPRVVLIPSNQVGNKGTIGTQNLSSTKYDFTATLIDEIPDTATSAETQGVFVTDLPSFAEGALVRASGDSKVYIIKEGYKRWIQSAEIFDFYGHLNFAVVNMLPQETVALYKDSWLVRAAGDEKVYEINGDGTRHWLDMTPEKFVQTGHSWDMVYVIDKSELEWYREGASVK